MERLRHQFLPGPAFAVNQHPPIGRRHQQQLLPQRLHGNAFPDDAVTLFALAAQPLVLCQQRLVLQGIFHHYQGFIDGKRFFEEIKGAQLSGFHRRLHGAVAGDHHHHYSGMRFANALQHLQAIEIGHPHVQQHHLKAIPFQSLETLGAAGHRLDAVAFVLQHRRERLADTWFIVYQ